ncbi:MAG: DNA polymerase IV [Candidatus Nomurabacteria bacterium]|nr:MAG: DNA polymerase IV [Candidatus Nomurabacteria bacterium]
MTWGTSILWPKAILHIDGDSFFAACEVAKKPHLKGKPVVTGQERGIVSAATYEAKALGVKRGMSLSEVRRLYPEVIFLPSDFETYHLFSRRMYEIVRRYTPAVEEYSIDECFADLGGMQRVNKMSYEKMAERIKYELELELGITFSVGLAPTKVLAKIGSKWQKPSGLTLIPMIEANNFLIKTPIESVWGIGGSTAAFLSKYQIRTAQDFVNLSQGWVEQNLAKPIVEVWRELRGQAVYKVDAAGRQSYQSLSKTKTFTPPSTDFDYVFSQLSRNIENACLKARSWNLVTETIFFFLKTQDFKYHGCEIKLPYPTAVPQEIISAIKPYYQKIFRDNVRYRATGVTLMKLQSGLETQLDLFGAVTKSEGLTKIFSSVDEISARYGRHTVFLGSSLLAKNERKWGSEAKEPAKNNDLFKGGMPKRRLNIPMLGEIG